MVAKAGWWILARTVSSILIYWSISFSSNILSVVIVRGLIAGTITGIVLIFLLEQLPEKAYDENNWPSKP
jgi:hypothetical protein